MSTSRLLTFALLVSCNAAVVDNPAVDASVRPVQVEADDAGGPGPSDSGAVSDSGFATDSGQIVPHDAGVIPPRDPVACPNVAGQPVGKWVDITPPAFISPAPGANIETFAVAINPHDSSLVASAGNYTAHAANYTGFIGGMGLWKSADCGGNWTRLDTPGQIDDGSTDQFVFNRAHPEIIFGRKYAHGVLKSIDNGVTWKVLPTDPLHVTQYNFVQGLSMDPNDSDHLVLMFHENCTAPLGTQCMAETVNGGEDWREFTGPDDGWHENAMIITLSAKSWLYNSPTGGYLTIDSGAHWKPVLCVGGLTQNCTGPQLGGGPHGGTMVGDTLYVGALSTGVLFSRADPSAMPPVPLGQKWTLLTNSPSLTTFVADNTKLYGSYLWDTGGQPFHEAPLANLTAWASMTSPQIVRGSAQMAYDDVHHIVYSANMAGGLWRLVTQ